MASIDTVSNGALKLGLTVFILATLATGLSDANFTAFVTTVITAINNNISNIGIAILGIVLGWGLPALLKLGKNK